ncbi:Outer membrane protein W [Methylacidimicrobium sp. AP8]|uniref:acyloxyacyl hydrolase n=1 Tax=Methylacidimicrobium sp. AP8 TaxID=2730359 RepID=UPI0018C05ED9|nr:acyloxyacyl hydrolase [Methylacidimicrobium sp. AP8]CAB4244322.1 Outer membrane protein W [Methylacidimicrobium sp. AP8]
MRRLCAVALALVLASGVEAAGAASGTAYPASAAAGNGDAKEGVALDTESIPELALYREGTNEIQFMSGALFSLGSGGGRYTFDEAPSILSWGWMLTTPKGRGIFRGNVEVLVDLYASGIFAGPMSGNVVVGPNVFVRYNFVQPNWRVVPYVEGGLGFVFTDAYTVPNQSMVGQAIEFTPQAGAGFRYMLSKHWSVNAEALFHHMSNADMAPRNIGVNEVGALVGFSYLLGSD